MNKWDRRLYELAMVVSTWSKDPSTRVGAVLVSRDGRTIVPGYNGFPPGIADDDRLEDREAKLYLVQCAERNAIDNARFYPFRATLYTTFFPCTECAKVILTKGVGRVVTPPPVDREPWATKATWSLAMFEEASVEVTYAE